MHARVVSFSRPIRPNAAAATMLSILTHEPVIRAGGLLLLLACQLAHHQQRVLLIDLDEHNDVARLCGLENLTAADVQCASATSCIALNRPFTPNVSFNFNTVTVMPAGLQDAAAIARLYELREARQTGASFASLAGLRQQYDFIVFGAAPMVLPYRSQNALADFSLWDSAVVIVPYSTAQPTLHQRMIDCATFIRSARLGRGNGAPCDVWLLPTDGYSDLQMLMRLDTQFVPNLPTRLPQLDYKTVVQELARLSAAPVQMNLRMAHVRAVAGLLEVVAQKCLSLRGA